MRLLMMGHKICFNGEIRLIIPKLSLLPLLIWSTKYYDILNNYFSIWDTTYSISETLLQYFFSYKTEFFSFQNNPQNLDLGLFRKGKTHITAKFYRTDLVICSHSRERKTLSYSQINMVSTLEKF